MARIKDTSVEAVKAAADMVAVVQGRTQLRKSGARWTGRCPFHDERTPSFSVNAHDKLFYCFGCGKGGDLVTFVRDTENLDFAGAVEWLAERFSVAVEYEESDPRAEAARRRRDRLYALLDAAAAFYERYLWDSPAGGPARDYLAGRGLREEVCREFRLGVALGGTTLVRKARERGFTDEELAAAGLANHRGTDYFAQRLLFPLADARGRIVGFQARKLREDDPLKAKYVNSPEGELFRKGSLLYGLHLARAAIAKRGQAYVVEGNTDVLALRQAGVDVAVAAMGTALTERQVKELSRLAKRISLCFDGDAAGEAATLRGMELAAAAGLDVQVVTLPPGLDPADLAGDFAALADLALPFARHLVRAEVRRAATREDAIGRVRTVVQRFQEKNLDWIDAINEAQDQLNLPREFIASLRGRVVETKPEAERPVTDPATRLERDVLAGVVAHPNLLRILAEMGPEHFDAPLHRRAHEQLLTPGLPMDEELVALVAELDARAAAEGIDEETAEQLLLRLRERQLSRELANADDERLADLQQALAKIRTAFREFA